MLGEIAEQDQFNYERALEAYRKVTWGPWVARARQRIAALTQKHLQLQTERIFRTDEQPVFALTSRNIESVRVRVAPLVLDLCNLPLQPAMSPAVFGAERQVYIGNFPIDADQVVTRILDAVPVP